MKSAESLEGTGLEVLDIQEEPAFALRRIHRHDAGTQIRAMERLAQAFVETPADMLQELVNAAVDLCGAESAGISVQQVDPDGKIQYHWVATAGRYAAFLDAMLPPYPSACAVCIERGRPQLFRVSKSFFDLMQVDAATVTDGLLIPWQVDETHGTIWIMAHGREQAFDAEDCRLMQTLANFAAMGVRQQRQQKLLMEQASAAAAAAMANDLAHSINNPLQSLTNLAYLAADASGAIEPAVLASELVANLERLSTLVRELLAVPVLAQKRSGSV